MCISREQVWIFSHEPQGPLQIASNPVMVVNTLHVLVWLQLAYRKEVMSFICCCLVAGLLFAGGLSAAFALALMFARSGECCWKSSVITSCSVHLAVQEIRWRLAGQNDEQRASSRRTAASRWALSQDRPVNFAGRRWHDCVVHAACFGLAVLARSLMLSRKKATPLVWSF